ncbi:hypothetical protein V2J09_012742 [Rumex salicifolius]
MPISIFLRTTLPFLLFLLHTPPSSAAAHPTMTDFDFIRQSCNATLYPDICYRSLSRYASAVSRDSSKLACVAIGVGLSRARRAAAYFSNLTHTSYNASGGCDRRAAAALADCSSTFSDAVYQMRGSLAQMRRLPPRASEEVRFQLGNVQTWMSAALTYEDTCTDGFDGVTDLRLKTDVGDRVTKVVKVTSNALALVNRYAASTAK